MDIEERLRLITREPVEELITYEELRQLLETNPHPVAYNGFEPSGPVHLGTGLICAYKMKDLVAAGVRVKILLATYHAWINNKLGGDMELIKLAADHFKHSWIALGVPEDKVEFIYAHEIYDDLDYWTLVLKIAKEVTITRAKRTLEIAGREEVEARKVADLLYTPMQVADIFYLNVDICQLGMDQRKANVLARELAPKLGYSKPICLHHHLLQGLTKPPIWPLKEGDKKRYLSKIKMSKSIPGTAIFIYDNPEEIRFKIRRAFCPPREVDFNPIIDIIRYIAFRERDTLYVRLSRQYGGKLKEYTSYRELIKDYKKGLIHPLDLKNTVAELLVEILRPVREYFIKNSSARKTLEVIRQAKITR
ncbi:MAG: tyrosine--tRNA ligase [Thermoprotei archaeon]|nr:MAG: tyrosine--tRNA ligase [Thermoprotei archaeon]